MNNFLHYYLCFISSEYFALPEHSVNLPPVKSGPPRNATGSLCPAYQLGWSPHCQLGSEWSVPQIPVHCQLSGVTPGNSSDIRILQDSGRNCLSYGSAYSAIGSVIGSEIAWERCGLGLKAEVCPKGGNRRLSVTCTPCSWIASSFLGDLGHLYDRYVPQSNATDFCGKIDIIFTILTILFI